MEIDLLRPLYRLLQQAREDRDYYRALNMPLEAEVFEEGIRWAEEKIDEMEKRLAEHRKQMGNE